MSAMKRDAAPDPHMSGTLSLADLARRWRMPRKQIRRMLARQELNFIMIRDKIRVPEAEIERYEDDRKQSR
jgi:excisionase family DNA binding protein